MTVTSLRFERITDPEEIRSTHIQNGINWKGPLTIEAYIEREKALGKSNIMSKNILSEAIEEFPELAPYLGIRYFALKNGSTIVSSCETLNRLGYFIGPGESQEIECNVIVCIGAVFTPQKYRGKGYASYMIKKLLTYYEQLRDDPQAPRGINQMSFTLYSEIGEYYDKFGFKSRHVPIHTITQVDEFFNKYCVQKTSENHGKFVEDCDYDSLVSLEDKEFKKNLLKLHKANKDAFVFTIKPDADLYRWFNVRDFFILRNIDYPRVPLTLGYSTEDKSHILWHHHWGRKCLLIIKIYINPDLSLEEKDNTLKILFSHAIRETKTTKLEQVEFWDDEIPLERFKDLSLILHDVEDHSKIYAQNDSLSAVRLSPTYQTNKIIWDNNTKFCWF